MKTENPKQTAGAAGASDGGSGGRTARRRWLWGVSAAVALTAPLILAGVLAWGPGASASPVEFTDVREQTAQFMEWERSITLTPEQEEIKREALSALPAPCCKDRTAHTCCCTCNMAKSWWGLAKYLIAEQGYGVEETREAVAEWFRFINPDGFSGDSCYTGGCGRAFSHNGCGGMDAKQVVF